MNKNFSVSNYPTLEKFLFNAVKLTKNSNIDKYKYSGYGIGFDRKGKISVGFGRPYIIFGVDMSSSVHVDNKKKDILILGDGSYINCRKMYSILLKIIKNFV